MKKIITVTLNPAVDFTVNVKNFTVDRVNRASAGRRDPGGKGINVATALAEGGFKPWVTGFLGKENSALFGTHFSRYSMEDRFLLVDGATREGIKLIDPEKSHITDINFPGFDVSPGLLQQFLVRFTQSVKDADYLVLSGSLPRGVPVDIYGTLSAIGREAGAFVAVDTSGEALRSLINRGGADLIKPNLDELIEIDKTLRESENPLEEVGAFYDRLKEKIPYLALSLGEQGSRLYSPEGFLSASAPTVDLKSTVGAGDTYLAGLIAGLAHSLSLKECLVNAASWAASTLTQIGPGLNGDTPPELYRSRVRIRPF
ncbi:MAG: 1-phosphofructokinase family hexose kinase [Spirochaetales bacterium]|nr:1-phosphofructokinase family hexose kinase [Spirochaetales bacterium]